jgi:hypothetical protein
MKSTNFSTFATQDTPGYFGGLFGDLPAAPKTEIVTRRLLVDNRDRAAEGSAFDFTVNFTEYEHVVSAELKMASIPKVANESYVVLDIDQLNDLTLNATNIVGLRSYAIAYFDSSLLSAGDVKPIKDFWAQKSVYAPPIRKLDKLSIKVLKPDGSAVDPATDTNAKTNVSLLLELGIIVTRRS